MLEIRELVIEARVVNDTSTRQAQAARGLSAEERGQLTDQIVRQVLETLNEQRERR